MIKLFLESDFIPLEPFVSTFGRIKAQCLICNAICSPCYANLKVGVRGCFCNWKKSPEEAVKICLENNFELLSEFLGVNKEVDVRCLKCGTESRVRFKSINEGHGCGYCSDFTFRLEDPSLIYLIEHKEISALKVGIMNSNTRRLKNHFSKGWSLINTWQFDTGEVALKFEKVILSWLRKEKGLSPHFNTKDFLQGGHTETASLFEISLNEVETYIQDLCGEECLIAC